MLDLLWRAALPTLLVGALYPFLGAWTDSARLPTACTAVIVGVVAWRTWPHLRTSRGRGTVAVGLAITLLPALWYATEGDRTACVIAAGQALLGWSLAGWLYLQRVPVARALGVDTASSTAPDALWDAPVPAWAPIVLAGVAFTIAALCRLLLSPRWLLGGDDVIYRLQAHWMWEPNLGWTVPEALRDSFLMRKLAVGPSGQYFGQYPPGWPAVLAVFERLGAPWLAMPLLAALSAVGTFRLGRLLYTARVGLVAACLLLLNGWWIIQHGTWMSHALTLPCALFTAIWLIEAESGRGVARDLRWLGAGFLIALLAAARPLDGAALALTFGLWMLLRGRMRGADIARCLVVSAVGAAPVTAGLLAYHHITNGEALRFGYEAINQGGNALGFGKRGVVGLDSTLARVPRFFDYTWVSATRTLLRRIASTNLTLAPYALFVPLLLLLRRVGHTPTWRVLGPFLILPALYSLYWYGEMRFLLVLMPFLLVWVAAGLERVHRHDRALSYLGLTAFVVGSLGLLPVGRWAKLPIEEPFGNVAAYRQARMLHALERIDALRAQHGKLLVVVTDGPWFDATIDRFYQFNLGGLDGDVLVVRDRGAVGNAEAVGLLPGRTVVAVRDTGRDAELEITVRGRDPAR